MFQRLFGLIVTLVLLVAATHVQASTILLAQLTNDQENPPAMPTLESGGPRLPSFGEAIFELNDAMTALTFTATIFNIDFTGSQTSDPNDNLTLAHIHAPALTPTTNAGVVWGFFGMPFNDNNPNDMVFSPFATGVGGTISGKWDAPEGNNTTLTAQLPNVLGGLAYINFHTVQFAAGEVRGAITTATVPEPSTLTLLGLCVVGLLGSARRRRHISA